MKNQYSEIVHKAEESHNCYLCRIREGNFKGSHLAPNFLIQPFLSTDETTDRDKTIATEVDLRNYKKSPNWGRGVDPETINHHFGELTDEEKESIKPNPLTRDYYFCHECENRFCYYETLYSDYFTRRNRSINPVISYLFWLGVFWRLSKANMCIKMSDNDEEEARHILDESMPYSLKEARQVLEKDNLGSFCYTIVHCSDTKGERMTLLGNHTHKPPYKLVIGKYIITMFPSYDRVESKYPLNDYHSPEKIVEVPFIEFWRIKQDIMGETERLDISNLRTEGDSIFDIMRGGENDGLNEVMSGICGKEIGKDVMDTEKAKYGFVIPGAIMKLLKYYEEHPFDDPEEIWYGFEKEYGYSQKDIEAIANEALDENKIFGLKKR